MINKKDIEFYKGFICACAITQKNHGMNSVVEDTLMCNFLTAEQMKEIGIDESDIKVLIPIIKEINRKRVSDLSFDISEN